MPTYEILLIVWAAFNVLVVPVFFLLLSLDYEGYKFTPNELYAHTRLNKIGSWLLCVLVGVLVPLYYVMQGLVLLCTKKG